MGQVISALIHRLFSVADYCLKFETSKHPTYLYFHQGKGPPSRQEGTLLHSFGKNCGEIKKKNHSLFLLEVRGFLATIIDHARIQVNCGQIRPNGTKPHLAKWGIQ